jgi:hypothetical protein
MSNKYLLTGKVILAILFLICPTPSYADEAEVEYVLRYEVVVERNEDGRYMELHKVSTEESFLELFLLPGRYQAKVTTYDLLNHPRATELITFEVRPPYPPPPFHFFLWPSWMTFAPVYGDLFRYFGFWLFPPVTRLAFDMTFPIQKSPFSVGTELAASWIYLNNFFDEHNIKVHMIMLDLNFLMQRQFSNQRVTLSFRIGAGLTILADEKPQEVAKELKPLTGQVNLGISCFGRIKDSSYIETGIDFSHLIGWAAGGLRPWIGFGIRF